MKCLFITFIIFNVFSNIVGNSFNMEAPLAKMMLIKMIKDKCYHNSTEVEFEKFTTLLENATTCIKIKIKEKPVFVVPAADFKNNLQMCTDRFILELQQCLPEQSKEWPKFSMNIVYSLVDFIYDERDHLVSPQFRTFVETCIENFQEDEKYKNEAAQCFLGIDINNLETENICRNLENMQTCLLPQINKRCPGDKATEKLKANLFGAIRKPCI